MTAKTIPSFVEVHTQWCGHVRDGLGNHLREVYGRYNAAKARAWEHCESLCAELDGFNLCITSANAFVFTAQFEFDNPENGRPMVCHITPSRTYAAYLDMQHLEKARFVWEEYARKESSASYIEQDYISDDGKCRIIWLCHRAYIVSDDEVYRVVNPFRRDGELREFVELQRVDACMMHGHDAQGATVRLMD